MRHAILLPLLLLAAPLGAQTAAPRAVGVSEAELRDLLVLARATDERWNARDAAGLSALFAAEGHSRILGTPADLRGRDAIRAYFATSLGRLAPGTTHRTVVDEVQRVAPDVVLVEGRVWIERAGADSARTPLRAFTVTSAVVREGEAWRVRWNRARPVDGGG
ncbi:SgcJ/EcaC family oxidoreductase [Roseisolibacter sp. H3M3-2]|uniref:SgcJ/EcaC family oxidoreductase n=1 Tax=Roseisolibacter sp. H3M3-2 TaxID=3031323 RepID=UPI0023DC8AF2|nr:SgcJ/EcaC family oxidoreductase [Roseisolibacter sp. H3M3-2]MDF1503718.1 SgcJ/EcaC family oxidoreductase [Roseisolibacter sp. H3M3-2]